MKKHIHHIHIIILIGIVTFFLGLVAINSFLENAYSANPVNFGVSFAPRYAKELGLDPKQTFASILDLGVKDVRLSAYWDEIEPFDSLSLAQGKPPFYFDDLDYYIEQAQKHHAKVILAVGYKLPGWPECRAPQWLDINNLREKQLIMVEEVISRYNENSTITAFQIENEPLLNFGACPEVDRQFFNKEMVFVRSITLKPLIVTDAGEIRPWITPMKSSDIFGTTLYRKVQSKFIGDFYYPIPAWSYRLKSDLVRKFFAPDNKKTIIVELQAEPWVSEPIQTVPLEEQIENFPLSQLKETISYAKKTGFDEIYFWGVEWWYYLAQHNHPEYLEYAKGLF